MAKKPSFFSGLIQRIKDNPIKSILAAIGAVVAIGATVLGLLASGGIIGGVIAGGILTGLAVTANLAKKSLTVVKAVEATNVKSLKSIKSEPVDLDTMPDVSNENEKPKLSSSSTSGVFGSVGKETASSTLPSSEAKPEPIVSPSPSPAAPTINAENTEKESTRFKP